MESMDKIVSDLGFEYLVPKIVELWHRGKLILVKYEEHNFTNIIIDEIMYMDKAGRHTYIISRCREKEDKSTIYRINAIENVDEKANETLWCENPNACNDAVNKLESIINRTIQMIQLNGIYRIGRNTEEYNK